MQKINARLSQRIAQEAQLLAEERWIIDALRKIKQQRNTLQIERLHLENLREAVIKGDSKSKLSAESSAVITAPEVSQPPPVEEVPQPAAPPEVYTPVTTLSQFDGPVAGIDDEMCNNEKLNLSVTDSVFTNQRFNGFDMEEDEEDIDNGLEDEEEDMENALIEMNMLMLDKPC